MPKVLSCITVMIVLIAAAALAQPAQSIVGSWVEADKNCRWTFRADGTGFMERTQPRSTARFSWQVRGNTLKLSTAGTTIPYSVVQNDGQNLVIRNEQIAQVYQLKRDGQ